MDNSDIRILVVDDDPDILFATVRILKKEGYEVIGAETGNECLEKTVQEQPDLILLDVDLPDILGTEVCSQLKNDPEHQKKHIMMLSSVKTSSHDQADGLDAGADDYIARPVSNREFLSRVQLMVRLIRAERKNDTYISELVQAIERIKVLSGIIPICMHCKQIRDDKGYWNQLEKFISDHSDARFSHGLCEACLKKYYPEED
jgi:DNA-binding response OmpR family regulator